MVLYKHNCELTHLPCLNRDGPDKVHFLGIDVSMEALHLAKGNLVKQCPQLSTKNIEMVCAEYLEGLKQARARCSFTLAPVPTFPTHLALSKHSACGFRSECMLLLYSASCMFDCARYVMSGCQMSRSALHNVPNIAVLYSGYTTACRARLSVHLCTEY